MDGNFTEKQKQIIHILGPDLQRIVDVFEKVNIKLEFVFTPILEIKTDEENK